MSIILVSFNSLKIAMFKGGSCEFVEVVCDACIEGVVVNLDVDNDGVCNDDEVFGCTDFAAINFNELATEDNGSCFYSQIECDLEFTFFATQNDCGGIPWDGGLNFSVTGGVSVADPDYDYLAIVTNLNTNDTYPVEIIDGVQMPTVIIPPGNYSIAVTDGEGCSISDSFEISTNTFVLNLTGADDSNCPDDASAYLEFSVPNDYNFPPYQYSLFNPVTSETTTGLSNDGIITLTNLASSDNQYFIYDIIDSQGCSASIINGQETSIYFFNIGFDDPPAIDSLLLNPVVCYGDELIYSFEDVSGGSNIFDVQILNGDGIIVEEDQYIPEVANLEFNGDQCCPTYNPPQSPTGFGGPTNMNVALTNQVLRLRF